MTDDRTDEDEICDVGACTCPPMPEPPADTCPLHGTDE